uniref:DUF3511 domain-containing protein n=1 Tax=Cajanus cajan TaxID=3821 RepID=A0A151TW82_CAJCA|nr:hypothetical protein KK1_010537 [Cajanus cajan]
MEGVQHHYARSCSYLHEVNVGSTNRNKMIVGRSNTTSSSLCAYVEPSQERYGTQMVVTTSKRMWWWNDPENKRKRRVAKYKLYAKEGKLKHSVKKGLRWFKNKCIKIVNNV